MVEQFYCSEKVHLKNHKDYKKEVGIEGGIKLKSNS